jgi:hypothetical protein
VQNPFCTKGIMHFEMDISLKLNGAHTTPNKSGTGKRTAHPTKLL